MIVSEVQNDVDLCVTSELNHPEYNPRPGRGPSRHSSRFSSRLLSGTEYLVLRFYTETRTNDDATNLQGGGFTFSVYM